MSKVLEEKGTFLYVEEFISHEELLDKCVEEVRSLLFIKPPIRIGNKIVQQRRNVGFFSSVSQGYKYSGQIMKSQPLTPHLTELLSLINEKFQAEFNGILINHYVDGNDYLSPHSDDESALDKNAGVVAISYGAERTFRISDKITGKKVIDVETQHCQIIQMGPGFQSIYKHGLPQRLRVKEERFSFTFRKHTS
jgi:alkylated DNA repair dioxygenase AlkB